MREKKDSGVPWIGEIPRDWTTKQLKYCADSAQENSFIDGDWIESPYIEETGIRYLTTGNIGDGTFKRQGDGHISLESFTALNCKYAYPGDLAIARLNAPYGRSCILPEDNDCYVLAVDIVIVRPREDSRFLCYITQCAGYQKKVEDAARGTTMLRISRTNLGKIKVPLPNIEEQRRIADFLDTKCAEIDSILEQTKASIEEYKKLKQSVITEAVTKGIRGERPMKDSGVEWIGEIPTEWRASKLKYVANTQGRIGFKGYTSADLVGEGEGALTIGGKHIGRNLLDLTDPDFISWEKYYESPEIMVAKGDLLIAQRGSVGKVALVNREIGEATINPSLVLIRCHSMNETLLYYNLIADFTQKEIGLLNTATAVPMISQWQINNLHIITPPLPEQQEIVTYLDEKCAAIDSLIASKEALIAELEAYKKSLIYEYVTGKKEVL